LNTTGGGALRTGLTRWSAAFAALAAAATIASAPAAARQSI
jgi:hypothetical protein